MSEPLELKKTLNLPKTDFPMKASLPLNEPKQLEAWQEADLYQKILGKLSVFLSSSGSDMDAASAIPF